MSKWLISLLLGLFLSAGFLAQGCVDVGGEGADDEPVVDIDLSDEDADE